MKRIVVRSLVGSCLLLLPLAAARAADDRAPRAVPPGHLPPPGECRVWHDGRPPGQQPAPTDCATARWQAERTGGRVIYGDDRGQRWRDDDRDGRDDDWDDDDRYDDRYDDDRYDDDRYDDRRGGDRRRDDDRDWERDRGRRPYGCSDADWRRGRCGFEELRCRDRDRDGWCDGSRYPVRPPEMAWGVAYARGRLVPALRPWLGGTRLGVRFGGLGRHGLPYEIVWFDRGNRIAQRWLDDDRDGFADRIAFYRGGRVERVLRYR